MGEVEARVADAILAKAQALCAASIRQVEIFYKDSRIETYQCKDSVSELGQFIQEYTPRQDFLCTTDPPIFRRLRDQWVTVLATFVRTRLGLFLHGHCTIYQKDSYRSQWIPCHASYLNANDKLLTECFYNGGPARWTGETYEDHLSALEEEIWFCASWMIKLSMSLMPLSSTQAFSLEFIVASKTKKFYEECVVHREALNPPPSDEDWPLWYDEDRFYETMKSLAELAFLHIPSEQTDVRMQACGFPRRLPNMRQLSIRRFAERSQ